MRAMRWFPGLLPAAMILAAAVTPPAMADDLAASPRVDVGLPQTRSAAPTGNPLWSIPLSSLSATRERPLFSPSRRPPPAADESGPPAEGPEAPAADPASEAAPDLKLVGTIAGPDEGFALFQEAQSDHILRLRTGQDHEGWVLQSVEGRSATLRKDGATATLSLPEPAAGATLHEAGSADSVTEAPESGEPATPAPDEANESSSDAAGDEGASAGPEDSGGDATATGREAFPGDDAEATPSPN